jgi:hypothetical protein
MGIGVEDIKGPTEYSGDQGCCCLVDIEGMLQGDE